MGRSWRSGGVATVFLFAVLIPTQAAKDPGPVLGQQAFDIGTEAYIYGYPLVTMEMTRRVMTNTARPDGTHAPMGQFRNLATYPDASFHEVIAPNADTLYSIAWLDLSKEPYVLSIISHRRTWYGSSAAPTVPAPRGITAKCMPSRTGSPSCRSAATAKRIRLLKAQSIRASI